MLFTGSDLNSISHKSEALCIKSDPSNAFATSMFTLNSRNASEDLKSYKLWYGLSHLKFWRSRHSDNQETLKVQMFWWCRRVWRSRSWKVETLKSRSKMALKTMYFPLSSESEDTTVRGYVLSLWLWSTGFTSSNMKHSPDQKSTRLKVKSLSKVQKQMYYPDDLPNILSHSRSWNFKNCPPTVAFPCSVQTLILGV